MKDYYMATPANMYDESNTIISWKHEKQQFAKKIGRHTFLDDIMHKEKKEGMSKNNNYRHVLNYKEESLKNHIHGHTHKDEFYKAERRTIPK